METAATNFKLGIYTDCNSKNNPEIYCNKNYEAELMKLIIGFQKLIDLYYNGKTQKRIEMDLYQKKRRNLLEIYKIGTSQDLRNFRDRILNDHN